MLRHFHPIQYPICLLETEQGRGKAWVQGAPGAGGSTRLRGKLEQVAAYRLPCAALCPGAVCARHQSTILRCSTSRVPIILSLSSRTASSSSFILSACGAPA
mmetsp:Transcript_36467/g.82597  ORF Transcript_36467/g.82597 Transcript_36467/m.82597 type:complete len:102 (-) Transcript_36467:526-831(-)